MSKGDGETVTLREIVEEEFRGLVE